MCRYYLILLLAFCIVIFCWSTPISAGFPFCKKPTMNDVFAAVRRLNEEIVAKIDEDLECRKVLDGLQQYSDETSKSSKHETETENRQQGIRNKAEEEKKLIRIAKEEKEKIRKKWNEIFEGIWSKEKKETIRNKWDEIFEVWPKKEKESIRKISDETFEFYYKPNKEENELIREKLDGYEVWCKTQKEKEEKESIQKKWDEIFLVWNKDMEEKDSIRKKWDEVFEGIGNKANEEKESILKKWDEIFEFWYKVKEQKESIRKICLWNQKIQATFSAILQGHDEIGKQIKELRASAVRHMEEAKAEAARNLSDEQLEKIEKEVSNETHLNLKHFQRKHLQKRIERLLENNFIQFADSEKRLSTLYEMTSLVEKMAEIDAQSRISKLLHDIALVGLYLIVIIPSNLVSSVIHEAIGCVVCTVCCCYIPCCICKMCFG